MTEQLLAQQLESPSGTGRVDPEVKSDSQAPQPTSGIPPSRHPILTGSSARRSQPLKSRSSVPTEYDDRSNATAEAETPGVGRLHVGSDGVSM